jgi:membrane protein insertase Oxa1/YidC/SpoIIIJ
VIAGVTTAIMIAANPDLPEQARTIMIALPSIVAFLFALNFVSALGVYWITSNVFTAIQTLAVHFVANRRIRNGSLAL